MSDVNYRRDGRKHNTRRVKNWDVSSSHKSSKAKTKVKQIRHRLARRHADDQCLGRHDGIHPHKGSHAGGCCGSDDWVNFGSKVSI